MVELAGADGGVRLCSGVNIMLRKQAAAGGAVLLGRLVLAMTSRADEAAVVQEIERLGGEVTKDPK